jgi:hypothetical protein
MASAPIPRHPAGGIRLETLQSQVEAGPGSSRNQPGPCLRFYTEDGTPVLLHRDETEAQWRAEQAAGGGGGTATPGDRAAACRR